MRKGITGGYGLGFATFWHGGDVVLAVGGCRGSWNEGVGGDALLRLKLKAFGNSCFGRGGFLRRSNFSTGSWADGRSVGFRNGLREIWATKTERTRLLWGAEEVGARRSAGLAGLGAAGSDGIVASGAGCEWGGLRVGRIASGEDCDYGELRPVAAWLFSIWLEAGSGG